MNNTLLISNKKSGKFNFVSAQEFTYVTNQDMKFGQIAELVSFEMDNFISNVNKNNNQFYYNPQGSNLDFSITIPQDFYKDYSTLQTEMNKQFQLNYTSGDPNFPEVIVSIKKVRNQLVLTFNIPVLLYEGENSIYKLLGISENNTAFDTEQSEIKGDRPFNLAQTPAVYIRIQELPCTIDEIFTFKIENNGFYGTWLTLKEPQKIYLKQPFDGAQLSVSFYDCDRNLIQQGLDDSHPVNIEMSIQF